VTFERAAEHKIAEEERLFAKEKHAYVEAVRTELTLR
jgi:hypothetical protein